MSIAMYAPQIDTTPAPYASPTLQLVVDNTRPEKPLSPREVDLKRRTADTHVLQFNAERMISRKDQIRVMDVLKKYAQVILSVLFRGSIVHYAVNLQQIDEQEHRDYLANIERDLTSALPPPLTLNFDTKRQMTSEHRKAVTEALQWAKHIVTSVSFHGETVHYAITIDDVDEQYRKTILMAIEGDIFVATRHGDLS